LFENENVKVQLTKLNYYYHILWIRLDYLKVSTYVRNELN